VKLACERVPIPFKEGNQDICGCLVLVAQLILNRPLLIYLIYLVKIFEEIYLCDYFGSCVLVSVYFYMNIAFTFLRNCLQIDQVLLFQHKSKQE